MADTIAPNPDVGGRILSFTTSDSGTEDQQIPCSAPERTVGNLFVSKKIQLPTI